MSRDKSPKRNWRGRDGPKRGRSRSRSPRFSGRDWKMGGISNNTQRDEDHMKKARIFVGNVDSNNISRSDLISVFSKHGDVVAVSIHAGYSFIQMDSERSANRAINYEHGATINGRKINVEFSTAALKAGARFKRLPLNRSPSPSQHPSAPVPPTHSYHGNEGNLADRERRIQRILALEDELKKELGHLQGPGGGHKDDYRSQSYSESTYPGSRREYDYPSRREDAYGINHSKSPGTSPRPRSDFSRVSERFGNSRYSGVGGYPPPSASEYAGRGSF